MATTIVPPTINDETSFADLRALIGGESKPEPAAEPEPEPVTSEPADKAEEHHEPATETGDKTPNPQASEEEPLPEGVQKRIAKEAEKAARIQAEIDRAVSERKAKEAELEQLKVGEKGSEPVNQPKSQTSDRPKRPQLGEKGHEAETYDQFLERERVYVEETLPSWIKADAIREFEATTSQREAQKAAEERWNAAVEKHKAAGVDFPALMESARALAPEGLQVAISALDNWDGVAVHLAKHPAELKQLAQTFQQNPTKAIATLGRIEAALTSQETKPATPAKAEKPLPEPLAKAGGSASASGQDFAEMAEKGSFTQLKTAVGKLRGKK
jgi:hypothetical protein